MAGGAATGSARAGMPAWVDYALLPVVNLAAAIVVSGLVILLIGENPVAALAVLVEGAFGYPEAVGFTLYYSTNFIFTGLAVAVAFHCGLFNIGGEGQAMLGGLGVALVALALDGWPWPVVAVLCLVSSALFGAAWAFVPAVLQARRGSHIVITTIMFNFIAAAIMTWLLVDVMRPPGQQSPETRHFSNSTWLPSMHETLGAVGIPIPASPLNLAFLWALACALLVYLFVWRTRWGFAIRTVGQNERAAVYAGISPARAIVLAMAISGGLAGFVGFNELLGVHHRLMLGFTNEAGFVGIAVALMGRNHPVGIVLAAILFGALYQGGSELSFEFPSINREMVVVIQGLVILFAGALGNLFRPAVAVFFRRAPRPAPAPGE